MEGSSFSSLVLADKTSFLGGRALIPVLILVTSLLGFKAKMGSPIQRPSLKFTPTVTLNDLLMARPVTPHTIATRYEVVRSSKKSWGPGRCS